MFDALLICITAFGTGFAAAWALGSRTREQLADVRARADEQARPRRRSSSSSRTTKSSLANAFKALSAEALNTNNQSFLQLATASLEKFQERAQGDLDARQKAVDALVQPIRESLVKVDGKLGEIEKTRQSRVLSAERAAPRSRRDALAEAAQRDVEPRESAAPTQRARPLGRDAAQARGRDGGHARALRLRRAAHRRGRGRPLAARSHREAARRQAGGHRREGADRGVSRSRGGHGRRRARGAPREARAARALAHHRARPQSLLGHVQPDARVRDPVPAGRDVLQRRARERSAAHRARREREGGARDADHADRAAARGGLRLAAGIARAERPGSGGLRQAALRANRFARRALERRRRQAREEPWGRTTRASARSSPACSSRPGSSSSSRPRRTTARSNRRARSRRCRACCRRRSSWRASRHGRSSASLASYSSTTVRRRASRFLWRCSGCPDSRRRSDRADGRRDPFPPWRQRPAALRRRARARP